MNIGIVTTWFERGAAYVSRQYLQSLQKEFNVFVYARGGEHYAKKDPKWDSDCVWWGKKTYLPISTAMDLGDFYKWINQKKIELVLFNEQRWWLPVLWAKQWHLKTVAYIDYYTSKSIPLFALYDGVICNTKRHYQAFRWHPFAYYVPWGTDLQLFTCNNSGLVSKGCVTFFHNCGYGPRKKNTDLVIRCFSKLTAAARLIVHSQVDIIKEHPGLEKLVSQLISDGRMEYIWKNVPAPGLYGLGDVYVYPSMSEGIGLTITEALASGLCCIMTDDPPMNEFAADGTALKVRVKHLFTEHGDPFYWPKAQLDEEDLYNKMNFCANHPEWVAKAKVAARDHAENNLDWTKNANSLCSILGKMPGPSRPSPELHKLANICDRESLPFDARITWPYYVQRVVDLGLKAIGRLTSSL